MGLDFDMLSHPSEHVGLRYCQASTRWPGKNKTFRDVDFEGG